MIHVQGVEKDQEQDAYSVALVGNPPSQVEFALFMPVTIGGGPQSRIGWGLQTLYTPLCFPGLQGHIQRFAFRIF